MTVELQEPILVIGVGRVGSKLATRAKKSLGADCLLVSNDNKDLQGEKSIKIDTNSIINPSSQVIRGFALEHAEKLKECILGYSSIIMMANLAGKSGSSIAPIVSSICRQNSKNLISFAVMPFGYENDRIFASGVSLKRVRQDSACTVIVDNDAMLQSNPDLSVKSCYEIANSAILYMAQSIKSNQIPSQTNILSTSKGNQDVETSFRDSLKMLYDDALPNSIKSSMIYVLGGNNIPIGMIKTISSLTQGSMGESTSVGMSLTDTEESGIVMLSTVLGQTKFDSYDPLGDIPMENTLDWDLPDCNYDCKLAMYNLE